MSGRVTQVYEFGPFRVDVPERILLRNGKPVPLTPKAFAVLLLLIEGSGRIVEKESLINHVWADSFVEEGNLKVTVSVLRKALEDGSGERKYIETVSRRGYRFVGSVRMVDDERPQLIVQERTLSTVIIEEEEETRDLDVYEGGLARVTANGSAMGFVTSSPNQVSPLRSRVEPGAVAPAKLLAVLPFRHLGDDSSDEYLGLGLADALITRLSSIRRLMVRPTSAVIGYDHAQQDALSAGQTLGVESVIEGHFRKSAGRIRVTVQLVSVVDGGILWAAKFDERFTDFFALEDSISEQVTAALTLKLSGEEKQLLTKRYTESTEAHQAYLKGRYYWNKRSADGLRRSIECFQQSIAEDERYALPYAGLADTFILFGNLGLQPPKEAFSRARQSAIQALECEEGVAEAHSSLGYVRWALDWDWPAAEREYLRAIELSPGYATAHQWYSLFLAAMGRADEALAEVRRSQEEDPVSLSLRSNAGMVFYLGRRYDAAIEQCRLVLDMDPNFLLAHLHLGWAYEQKGMHAEAIAEVQKAVDLSAGGGVLPLSSLAYSFALSGDRQGAKRILSELGALSSRVYVSPIYSAVICAALGDNDEAFQGLEKAYDERSNWLPLLKVDPKVDGLRSDPRFAELLHRLALDL